MESRMLLALSASQQGVECGKTFTNMTGTLAPFTPHVREGTREPRRKS